MTDPSLLETMPGAEFDRWRAHRRLLLKAPRHQTWRGCIGLGLALDQIAPVRTGSDEFFVRDRDIRWCSLVDIPYGHFFKKRPREVHWASVGRTSIRFGMPHLGWHPESQWDFRMLPWSEVECQRHGEFRPGPDVMPADTSGRFFTIFNDTNNAMTSAGDRFRSRERSRSDLPPQRHWMPRAYLAFPRECRKHLWDILTRRSEARPSPVIPKAIHSAFQRDLANGLPVRVNFSGTFLGVHYSTDGRYLRSEMMFEEKGRRRSTVPLATNSKVAIQPGSVVRNGSIVGFRIGKLPSNWQLLNTKERGEYVRNRVIRKPMFEIMRDWFDEFVLEDALPGLFHVPAEFAAPAAFGNAVDEGLLWNLHPCMDYHAEETDSFILPVLPIKHWDALTGALPGEVRYDFTPRDPRLRLPPVPEAGASRSRIGHFKRSCPRRPAHSWAERAG